MTSKASPKIKQPTTEEKIAGIISDLKTSWGEKKISASTIHLVLKECMEIVENFNNTGVEKKEYVITIIKKVVKDLVENEEEERIILALIDKKVLENTMDLIILASKGKFNINNKKTQKKFVSCFKTTIPLIIDTVIYIIKACKTKPPKQSEPQSKPQPSINVEII
jgi:hypothetical protein